VRQIQCLRLAATFAVLIAHAPVTVAGEGLGSAAAPVEIADEPMHHIRLLNSSVRVYEAIIPAGEATLFHTHRFNGVGIDMTAVRLEVEKVGAAPEQFETVPGDIWPANAVEPFTHRVTNHGAIPFRSIVVERLNAPREGAEPATPLLEQEPALDNDLFRAYRVTLKPGETTSDVALRPDTAMIAVSGGQVVWGSPGKAPTLKSMAPGELEWIPALIRTSIANTGVTDFVAVVIELK
jgi:hypothetical protein